MCDKITDDEITSWTHLAMKNMNFTHYQVYVHGTSECGGYIGDIVFVTVKGTTNDNKNKELNLVIKMGKKNETLRRDFSIRQYYMVEINFYGQVIPLFNKFQLEKNVRNIFDAVPKCYKTLLLEDMEVLVFEDMKKLGYKLHDKLKYMNLAHIKLILANYAKLHALSFALRDQKKYEFDQLTRNYNVYAMVDQLKVKESFEQKAVRTATFLKERGEQELAAKFDELMKEGAGAIIDRLIHENVKESVITHGDCWNNNFLFKYVDGDESSPDKVAILDWQLSSLHSPAMDLSYFLYSVSSKLILSQFDELLEFYYSQLSNSIKELGSNPDELFPYPALRTHWRKYSVFGMLMTTTFLDLFLYEDKDINIDNIQDGDNLMDNFTDVKINNVELYEEKIMAVLEHFCNYEY